MADAVESLDKRQMALEARYAVYSLIAQTFSKPPQSEMLEVFSEGEVAQVCAALPKAGGAEASLHALEDAARVAGTEGCRDEFSALFAGLREAVYPWESVHVGSERLLFQPCTLAVREAYRREGFRAAGYPSEPDDHVVAECSFMAKLAERAAASHAEGDRETCLRALGASERFLAEHLGVWLEAFANAFLNQEAAPRDGFYACCARFASDFVDADRKALRALLGEIEIEE